MPRHRRLHLQNLQYLRLNPCVASTSGPLRRAPPRVRRARIPSQVHGQRCADVAEGPAAFTPFARRCASVPPRLRPAGVLGFNASGLADVEGFQRAKALMDKLNSESVTDVQSARWVTPKEWVDWRSAKDEKVAPRTPPPARARA